MPRAIWKGYLRIDDLTCPVALYSAASTAERVSFHTINRETGNRVRREYVDVETGKPVVREDQVKGYETGPDEYIILEPEEMARALPDSDKTLNVETFLTCPDIDTTYFDKPYYLKPADAASGELFALVREGLRAKSAAALARAVLFRRVRTVLIRAQGCGLVANTLNFDYEVRSANEAFDQIPDMKVKGDMLDLAKHIIETKRGSFDPSAFTDRYDDALAELVKAKSEGREIKPAAPVKRPQVVDLMEALRQSAGGGSEAPAKSRKGTARKPKAAPAKKAPPRRKAS